MRNVLLSIAFTLLAGTAAAQPTIGPLQAGFGTATSYSSASGEVDSAIYGQTPDQACFGFISTQPSHRVNLRADFADMRWRVDSYGVPASLLVYGPNGRRCSGLPMINPELGGPWPAGTYTIFVGSQTQYGWISYDLLIGEDAAALERLALERSGYFGGEGGLYGSYEEPVYGELLGGLGTSGAYPGEPLGTGPPEEPLLEVAPPPADATVAAAERPIVREAITIDPSSITALVYDGTASQETAAADLAPPSSAGCTGMVGINPDFSPQVVSQTDSLLLELDAPTGPAIVRFGPVGSSAATWACTASVGTPARLGGDWAPGTYLVWLGTTGGPGAYLFTVAAAP